MKLKHLLMKTLFVAVGLCVGQSVWGQDPTPVYFNDFNTGSGTTAPTGLTIHGDGTFVDEGDVKFGMVFQNGGGAQRTHYLQLPDDVLSHSATSKKMTIGFWVNKGNAGASSSYMWAPLFTAYGAAPVSNANTWPVLACQYRGVLQLNNAGWCDYVDCQNVKGSNAVYHDATDWLTDAGWHYYTVVFDNEIASVYFDGVLKNQWNVAKEYWKLKVDPWTIVDTEPADPSNYDHCVTTQTGLYSNGSALNYVCLGGNQAWGYADNDAAFKFDDFAVYDEALTPAQLVRIIAAKKGLTEETYDFTSASPANSTGCVSEGNVTVDGSSLQILGNTYFDMKGRFAGGTRSGGVSYWQLLKNNGGLQDGSGNASKDFAIMNLTAGDYVTINYNVNGAAFTFQGANNITGLAAGTSIVSGQIYKIETPGNLLLRGARDGSNYPKFNSIIILTSTPVLNKPTVTFNSMVESGDLYYPKYTFSSADDGVTFYDGDGNDISSGYTFMSAGSQTVYAGKAGRTNSAKVSFSADKVGMILANSVNCKALSGTIDYSTGTVFSSGRFDNSGTFSTSLVPGLSFAGDNWYATTGGVYTGSGSRTVSCTVLNDNRVATFKHYDYDVAANIYNYLTTANNSTSIKRQGGSTPKNDYLHEYNLYVLPSEVVSVTIGSTGYSTFSSPVPLNFAGIDGLTAYVATEVAGGNVTFTSVTTAPANTGLLLKGTAGQVYNIPVAVSAATPASNLMVGCIVNTTVAVDATSKFNNYVLVNNGVTAEFQSLADNGATIPAGKAFLKNGAYSAGARSLTIVFDDEDVTGVNEVRSQKEDVRSEWFDLQGRKVAQPAKGLYIVNGKKVVIK